MDRVPQHLRAWASLSGIRQPLTGIDPVDPALWPAVLRHALNTLVCVGVALTLWLVWLAPLDEALLADRAQEMQWRDDYRSKLAHQGTRTVLMRHMEQLQQTVVLLEQPLSAPDDMERVLSDVHQAGLDHRLRFELFRPAPPRVSAQLVEWPIALRVVGRYHDIALFLADLANFSRVVTIDPMSLSSAKGSGGLLVLEGTVTTFRHPDPPGSAQPDRPDVREKPSDRGRR